LNGVHFQVNALASAKISFRNSIAKQDRGLWIDIAEQ
jgi:hypothetical protein